MNRVYGVLAEFDSAAAIFHACEQVRDAHYRRWDAHTPFPVHGLDRAMGLERSRLPILVFLLGITGVSAGMGMQWWMASVDYPIIIAAKPYFSWQAFIPVSFEVMILLAAAGAVFGMLFINRLPQWHHSLLKSDRFRRASDDRFYITIEASDAKFDAQGTLQFLQSLGASAVELVEE